MTDLYASTDPIAQEREFLVQTYRLLKWERKAWRICGVVWLIASVFLIVASAFLIAALPAITQEGYFSILENAITGLVYGIAYLPLGIIALVAARNIPEVMEGIYIDARPALTRCSSIGRIVFTALFCTVALVFYLINFVQIKSNPALIERILARQQEKM